MAASKVLVVDDSALMRRQLRDMLQAAGFEVAIARDGADALVMLERFQPDVVTLDINMPEMDGLTCLSRIMVESPRPVVMVSSLTAAGAEVTLAALELGAVDFVEKPGGTVSLDLVRLAGQIVAKVRAAAGARVSRSKGLGERLKRARVRRESAPKPSSNTPGEQPIVLIGSSTGGPRALETIVDELPADLDATVLIAQHMPAAFTGVFARRLNERGGFPVREVAGRVPLEPACCYVARGDADCILLRRGREVVAATVPSSDAYPWHPSVDRLVETALEVVEPSHLIGVLLTGMGDDGAAAMAKLRRRGGRTIAEAESTAVVFGMPKRLIELGGATTVLPGHRITRHLLEWIKAEEPRRIAWGS
jgi:two-component system chemotaxis response regulator CheB